MTDRDLMQQALEALIWTTGSDDFGDGGKAREGALKLLFPSVTALRNRLAQPEQEPVAWASSLDFDDDDQEVIAAKDKGKLGTSNCDIPLYATPKQWVGLTAYEIQEIHLGNQHWGNFACAIEAKLKEKNT